MNFTINAKQFASILADCKRFADMKGRIPILKTCLVEASENQITITATDLEFGIVATLQAEVAEPGNACFDVAGAIAAVKGVKGFVTVSAEGARGSVAGIDMAVMSKDSFPELPAMPATINAVSVADMQTSITRTRHSISFEESRFTLNGALMEFTADCLRMVATDGHRLAFSEVPSSYVPHRSMIKSFIMGEIQRFKGGYLEFSEGANHQYWRADDRLMISRKLTGNFPDYERVMPHERNFLVTFDRAELLAACERGIAFRKSAKENPAGVLTINGHAELSAKSDLGNYRTELQRAQYSEVPEFSVGWNMAYMADYLKSTDAELVTMAMNYPEPKPNQPNYVRDAALLTSEPGYKYVLMPMRI